MLVALCVTAKSSAKSNSFSYFILLGWYVVRTRPTNIQPQLDEHDDSLRKWKESLGLGAGKDLSDPNDPRTCIILSLGLEV